ncbi:MAG: hypothetical protein L0099_06505 [Acidobacteria bacterium]|nr:hypothetical protein [Acidobacteriota bacterium]
MVEPMPAYWICGSGLASNLPLPELQEREAASTDFTFELCSGPAPAALDELEVHQWNLPDGPLWLTIARQASGYRLRFPELADFLVNDALIRCHPVPGTPPETIRHLLLNQVFPLVLSAQGKLVLHGGAVVAPRGAIAFVGASGVGKSTLTACFCRQGFPLLTDDPLLLEQQDGGLTCVPSYPGLRLWDDVAEAVWGEQALPPVAHYTAKMRLGPERGHIPFSSQPALVRRIYFLIPPESNGSSTLVSITPIPPSQGFMELVKHTYLLDVKDQVRLREGFASLTRLMARPLLRRLSYPRDLARLPEVQEAILQDIQLGEDGL